MPNPLSASSSTAGALMSSSTFVVPQFQREYAWGREEVGEFWSDLHSSLEDESYFLGLIILTEEGGSFHVVDGQQRIITLTLLATALYHEAIFRDRRALADRIQSDFLRSIDYETDKTDPRVRLSDPVDDSTFQALLEFGEVDTTKLGEDVSSRMVESYLQIQNLLRKDLARDPFKQLGRWADFISNKLYFAVFIHPDPISAYQVYEVINTRGMDLTTADLLKSYIISQTAIDQRPARYDQWKEISRQFPDAGPTNLVQYIRHVVTVEGGYILPKDLFGFLAQRVTVRGKRPPPPDALMALLGERLPLYLQMIDPTAAGPAESEALGVFAALNSLNVITVRPILLAMSSVPDSLEGMRFILRLVVSRIVVSNLGTGNVERRFGEAAKKIATTGNWRSVVDDLSDLYPTEEDFKKQLQRRRFSKNVLGFIRRSIVQNTLTPDHSGVLHLIAAPEGWLDLSEEEKTTWSPTIGNSFLAKIERRPKDASDWQSFKRVMLPEAVAGEWVGELGDIQRWDVDAISKMGHDLAEAARKIWFG
jgi:hypothetical protein